MRKITVPCLSAGKRIVSPCKVMLCRDFLCLFHNCFLFLCLIVRKVSAGWIYMIMVCVFICSSGLQLSLLLKKGEGGGELTDFCNNFFWFGWLFRIYINRSLFGLFTLWQSPVSVLLPVLRSNYLFWVYTYSIHRRS